MIKQTKGKAMWHTTLSLVLFLFVYLFISAVPILSHQITVMGRTLEYLRTNPSVVVVVGAADSEADALAMETEATLRLMIEHPEIVELLPEWLQEQHGTLANPMTIVLFQVFAMLLYIFFWWKEDAKIHDLQDFRLDAGGWLQVASIALLWQFASICLSVLSVALGFSPEEHSIWSDFGMVAGVILSVFVAPLLEELFFRGILFNQLRSVFTLRIALIIQAVCFGLMHGLGFQTLDTAVAAIFFALLYLRTGRISNAIAAHMLFNIVPNVLLPFEIHFMHTSGLHGADPATLQHALQPYLWVVVLGFAACVCLLTIPLRALNKQLPPVAAYTDRMAPYTVLVSQETLAEDALL